MKNSVKKLFMLFTQIYNVFSIKNDRIFLMSFDGTKLGFDSLAFVNWLNKYHKNKYEIIWGVKDSEYEKKLSLENTKFVSIKSIKGIYYLKTSKVLLYNINPPSYLKFRKQQILVNSWHGYAFKKVGKYVKPFDKKQFNMSTCMLSHSNLYSKQVIKDSFEFSGEILNIGTPRNDVFFNAKQIEMVEQLIKKQYGVSSEEKVLLYAPTFRNDFEIGELNIDIKSVKNTLEKRFNCKCCVFLRLHPLITSNYKPDIENVVDVSLYPNMQDLLCTADFLITDYSSCIWDFGLMKKPAFIFADDYENYKNGRGLYSPLEETPFKVATTNEELLLNINNFSESDYYQNLNSYYEKIGTYEKGVCCEQLYKYLLKKGFE